MRTEGQRRVVRRLTKIDGATSHRLTGTSARGAMVEHIEHYEDGSSAEREPPDRFKSHCQGRCGIPYLEDLRKSEKRRSRKM